MVVWEKNLQKIPTPENVPRLFDLVKAVNEKLRPAFYFALRDTLVANDLEEASRIAFQKDKRWRVVTLQGQIIEQSGIEVQICNYIFSFSQVLSNTISLLTSIHLFYFRNHDWWWG